MPILMLIFSSLMVISVPSGWMLVLFFVSAIWVLILMMQAIYEKW